MTDLHLVDDTRAATDLDSEGPAGDTGRAATNRVLTEVWHARVGQDSHQSLPDHPDGTGGLGFELSAMFARLDRDQATAAGECTWTHVLAADLGEVFATTDPTRLRAQLVRAAADTVAWIETLDHRARNLRPAAGAAA